MFHILFEIKVEEIYMAGMIYMRLQYIRDEVNDVNAITYDNSSHNFAALSRSCVINTWRVIIYFILRM